MKKSVQRVSNYIKASVSIALCLLLAFQIFAQETQAVSVSPSVAIRGQLVWIRLSQEPKIIRVFKITSNKDVVVNKSNDNIEQLVCIDTTSKLSYVFSVADTGKFYVEAIFEDDKKTFSIEQKEFEIVDSVPKPPEPEPTPVVENSPFPSPDGVRVLIISEVDERGQFSPSKRALLTSATLREFLKKNTVNEGSTAGYRIWDDDYTDLQLSNVSDVWKTAYKAAMELKNKYQSQHLLLVASPAGGWSGVLPDSEEEIIEIVKRFVK